VTPVWPRRRDRPRAPDAVAVAGDPAVHRAEWRGLPPIQRAVTPVAGTFGTGSFERGLASRRSPGLLGALGHYVTPEATGGTYTAVARPPEGRRFPVPPGFVVPPSDGEEPLRELAPTPVPPTPASAGGGGLVTAPAMPVLQRRPAIESVLAPSPAPVADSGGPDPSRGPGPEPVVARPSSPGPAPSAPILGSAPSLAGRPPPSAPVPTPAAVETPRKPGLGQALPPGVSRLPVVQRTGAPPVDTPSPAAVVAERPALRPASETSSESGVTGAEASGEAVVVAPAAGDRAAADVAPLVGLRRLPTTTSEVEPATERGSEHPVPRTVSLVTAPDPHRSHRPPDASPGPTDAGLTAALDPVAPLVAERAPLASPSIAPALDDDRPAGLGRQKPHVGTPATASPIRSAVAPPAVQRAGATSPPSVPPPASPLRRLDAVAVPEGPAPAGHASFVDAGAVAVAAGLASRAPDGSVLFGPAAPVVGGVATRRSPVVQRESDDAATPAPGPRALDAAAPSNEDPAKPAGPTAAVAETPTPKPTPTVVPTPAAPANTPAGAAMSDREIDRLARRLYPRLRDHLRGELRLDRERQGRASDVGIRG